MNDTCAVGAIGLGTGRPDQIGGGLFECESVLVLRALAHSRHGQHFGPNLEQELPYLVAHRHVLEHVAHFDRVLNRQGFLLFHLLGNTDHLLGRTLFGQKFGQELLEFFIDDLIDLLAGFRILLNNLHDALDFQFHGVRLDSGRIEPHHTGAHAVDQEASRVGGGPEKIRVFQCHPQHRHLKPGKPDSDTGGDALLGQNGLEHQGHNFNGGLFTLGLCLLLQFDGFFAQVTGDPRNACRTVIFVKGSTRRMGRSLTGLRWCHSRSQRRRRCRVVFRAGKVTTSMADKQSTDLANYALRPATRPCDRRGRRHHAGLFRGRIRLLHGGRLFPERCGRRRTAAGRRCPFRTRSIARRCILPGTPA